MYLTFSQKPNAILLSTVLKNAKHIFLQIFKNMRLFDPILVFHFEDIFCECGIKFSYLWYCLNDLNTYLNNMYDLISFKICDFDNEPS